MESGQLVDLILMEHRLRTEWSHDERAWRLHEARRLARRTRGLWWVPLVRRRPQDRQHAARGAAATAGA